MFKRFFLLTLLFSVNFFAIAQNNFEQKISQKNFVPNQVSEKEDLYIVLIMPKKFTDIGTPEAKIFQKEFDKIAQENNVKKEDIYPVTGTTIIEVKLTGKALKAFTDTNDFSIGNNQLLSTN